MGKLFYYISSALNILKFNKKLPEKPNTWYGPFSKKDAENMQQIIKNKIITKKERMRINKL
jgi:hypothetical protein